MHGFAAMSLIIGLRVLQQVVGVLQLVNSRLFPFDLLEWDGLDRACLRVLQERRGRMALADKEYSFID
jgi:hypothetical protein